MTIRAPTTALFLVLACASRALGQDTLVRRGQIPMVTLEFPAADSLTLYRAILGPALDTLLATTEPSRKVLYIPTSWFALGKPALDSIRKRHKVRICRSEEREPCPERHYRGLTFTQFRMVDTDEAVVGFTISRNASGPVGTPCFCDPWLVERRLEMGQWQSLVQTVGWSVTIGGGDPTFALGFANGPTGWRTVGSDSTLARIGRLK